MITYEQQAIDTDIKVFDIFWKGTKVGTVRKSDFIYLEVLYHKYKFRLNQRQFIEPVIRLMCGLMDLKSLTEYYTLNDNLKPLAEGLTYRKGFTIKD